MGNSKIEEAAPLASHTLQYAITQLDYKLRADEIPALRRFVNLYMGQSNDLFHNHSGPDKYHYRYPLLQYKSLDKKAVLMGITDQGAQALEKLLQHPEFRAQCIEWIGEHFAYTEQTTDILLLHPTPHLSYSLSNYIALNQNNLADWHNSPSLPARAALLERCIVGHILKFCSAIKWLLPPKSLQVELLDFRSHTTHAFNNTFLAFDVLFRTNITLPEHIGLGKAVSHGFGLVMSDKC